jgi:hypothetical protein
MQGVYKEESRGNQQWKHEIRLRLAGMADGDKSCRFPTRVTSKRGWYQNSKCTQTGQFL